MTVDTTIRYQSAPDGQNFTFSLSKPLNELTTADIVSADAFVGFTSFAHNQLCEGNLGTGIPENNPNHCWAWSSSDPFGAFPTSWDGTFWSYPANFSDGVYMRNILVYRPLNTGGGASLTNTNDAVRIVVEVTPDEDTSMQKLEAVTGNNGPFIRVRYNNDQNAETRLTDFKYISPAVVLVANDVLYLFVQRLGVAYQNYTCWNTITAQGYSSGYQNFENSGADHRLGLGWTRGLPDTPILTDMIIDSQYPYTGNGHFNNVNFNGRSGQLNLSTGSSSGDIWHRSNITLSLTDVDENKDITKMYLAFSGCRFKVDDTWYKPIVEGGIVTGYTDDMTVESEWDTWTKASGHNVPSGPPTPPFPGDDEWDSITRGPVGVGGAGLLKVYAMSLAELATFSSWMNSVDSGSGYDGPPEGFNVIDSIIGLAQYPVNFTGGTQTTLVFTNSAADPQHRVVNSHCNANRLVGVGTTQHFSLGSIKIDKKFDNDTQFLDYDTLVEVYIPFCGIFTVDTQVVMGRTLSGDIWIDPVTGGCYAEIDCSLDSGGVTPIIMAEGNMGIEMPITSTQYSMSIAAQATNRNSYIAGAIGSVLGAAITAVAGGLAGGAKATSDTFNAAVAAGSPFGGASASTFGLGFKQGFAENLGRQGISALSGATSGTYNAYRTNKLLQAANNTAVKGGLGSSFAVWAQPWNAYVKITRYNKQVPGNYKHTIGVPVVMNKTLGEYRSGDYIVCVNPDLSGFEKATPEELSQIYSALTSGVYV